MDLKKQSNENKYGDLIEKSPKRRLMKGKKQNNHSTLFFIKLNKSASIFDSADYFMRLAKLKESKLEPSEDKPMTVFEFLRKKEDGKLNQPSKVNFDTAYLQEKYIKPKG